MINRSRLRPAVVAILMLCGFVGLLRAQATRTPSDGDSNENGWAQVGHDIAGTFHSTLKDINASNVKTLGVAWDYRLSTHRGLEATPIVINGTMYASGNFGRVYALDAATGRELWQYDPGVDGQAGRHACCDAVNRGVAFWKGRIYVAALDGYLHAIDAVTGKRIWKIDTLPARRPESPYTLTGTPVIAGNSVVVGTSGGDFHGVRGYVEAFDLMTGAFRWRFYTVPRDPKLGAQDQSDLATAVNTWDPHHRWETGGGGAVWDGISYDPQLNLIYVGTGNPAPYDLTEDGRVGGDSLYTDCILALNADSGALAWHYQVVPGDKWDLDSTQKLILADLTIAREPRKVVMQASKNGFFYVLDRVTGSLISARPFAFVNWTKGIDPHSGRPLANPAVDYSRAPKLIFPWEGGAHSWQAMSYASGTHQVFIPVIEAGDIQIETAHLPAGLTEGQFTSPIIPVEDYDPRALKNLYGPLPPLSKLTKGLPSPMSSGFLLAWDPVSQRQLWRVATARYWNGGILSTDGGVVIQGDIAGRLNVYDAGSGRLLKSLNVETSIMAAPMAYRIGDVEYIAVMAGYGGGQIGEVFPENSAAYRYGNQGRIIAFKLGGTAPASLPLLASQPLPMPPPDEGSSSQLVQGEILYNRYCSRCHVFGRAVLPDLRRLSPEKHEIFADIVLRGVLQPIGMGRFDDVLKLDDVDAIHAYLVHEAWKQFAAQPPVR
jgi:quinohemoprotein ethanol dehydrogenase